MGQNEGLTSQTPITGLCPETPEQLAEAMRACASEHRTICLGGRFSKDRLAGRPCPAAATISTRAMNRLLKYDPGDLTVSVEAGMPWADLDRTLREHGQMLPLDPGWAESTVGGVVAANVSGPRRRFYGTARDMIIGMTFATLEGKLVNSGGMVVKNVAGLDMAKLMIGSFGTLAGIATINFKVFPIPAESRTFVFEFETAAEAYAQRDHILQSVLQPTAIDVINWPSGFRLLVRASGSRRVVDRYAQELGGAKIENDSIWYEVCEFTPRFLAANPDGAVVPIVSKLSEMAGIAERLSGSSAHNGRRGGVSESCEDAAASCALKTPFIARAGSGVIYAHYAQSAPEVETGGGFEIMTRMKEMFDPERLLNRGRLYGRI